VNREWDEDFGGVALFACSGLGVYRLVRSYSPFDQAFYCSERPALRAAICHAHKGQPAILCMAKGDWGRLLEYELGGFRREFSFRDEEFPGRHDQGGWSQARYSRHVEEHLNRNFKKLLEHLVKWKDERDVRSIILSGTESDLALFEPMLPTRARQAICGRLHLDPNATLDLILAEVEGAIDDAREREDHQAADVLLDKGLGSGRAVAGPEPVARAVGAGKVHVLYLDGRFQERGWKCFDCGTMGVKIPLGCPACNAPVETVELGEVLVRGTVAADGRVVSIAEHAGLRAEGGVAALLRYA
jgi:peptide chain release factor subunit 1